MHPKCYLFSKNIINAYSGCPLAAAVFVGGIGIKRGIGMAVFVHIEKS